ncbi:MAG: cytochrome c oxidase assembly protein [Gemmatimonadales bacterium]
MGIGLWRLTRLPGGRPRWRDALVGLTVILLWMTLDWPVGPLGAGYLLWVHSAQFILLAMVIPPVLLLGLGDDGARRLCRRPDWAAAIRIATDPLPGILLFAAVMIVTHLPNVVDGLMKQQLGAFALDAAWLVSGVLFWWPIVLTEPARPKFVPLLQMVYLFFGTQPHLYIAMWLLLGDFPKYATYELAPRMSSLSALQDQAVAGGLMLSLTLPIVFGVLTVIAIRWVRREPA